MNKVRGRNVEFYVEKSGVFLPAACGLECSLDFGVELISTSTADSGIEEDFTAGLTSCKISFSGLVSFDDTSKYNLDDFIDTLRVKQHVKMVFEDTSGNTLSYTMWMLVESVRAVGNVNDYSVYDVTGSRCGAHVKTKVIGGVVTSYLLDGGDIDILDGGGDLIEVP